MGKIININFINNTQININSGLLVSHFSNINISNSVFILNKGFLFVLSGGYSFNLINCWIQNDFEYYFVNIINNLGPSSTLILNNFNICILDFSNNFKFQKKSLINFFIILLI